jgi:dihydroorotate dehydrogenase (fumarate)
MISALYHELANAHWGGTMDLTTRYLGLTLAHPFMPGASPLVDDLDTVLKLEDAGAAAIVMHSLFKEQILRELPRGYGFAHVPETQFGSNAEPESYFPFTEEFALGPYKYLEQVRRIKARVAIPVIASLNGTTTEDWLEYARPIEQAGADALEINFYHLSTNSLDDGATVERNLIDIAAVVKESVSIPVAVKLSPFYSSLPHVASQLDSLGIAGLIIFNRFYQADIDPENLQAIPRLDLSTSSDLLLRLHWLASLSAIFAGSLAVTGGVHQPIDAVKAVMAGADAVQLVSALLRNGPQHLTYFRREFERWGDDHGYGSIDEMRDKMSLKHCPDPLAFERGNYLRVLQSWRGVDSGALDRH